MFYTHGIISMIKKSDIIIVGNGPSCLERKTGNFIDSYKTVVRFNSYFPAIMKYKDYLGTRTNVWFTVPYVNTSRRPVDHIYYHNWENIREDKYYKELRENFKDKKVELIPDSPIETIRENFNYIMPSTGLLAIVMFLETLENIDIIGFDWWTNKYEYIHFYNKTDLKQFDKKIGHHPEKEKEIILSYGDRINFV